MVCGSNSVLNSVTGNRERQERCERAVLNKKAAETFLASTASHIV